MLRQQARGVPPQLRQAALRYAAEALAALGRPAEAARHLVAVLEGAADDGEAGTVRASSWLVMSGWDHRLGMRFLSNGVAPADSRSVALLR